MARDADVRRMLSEARTGVELSVLTTTADKYRRAYEFAVQCGDESGAFEAGAELGWVLTEWDVAQGIEVQQHALDLARAHSEWWSSDYRLGIRPGLSYLVTEGRLAISLVSAGRLAAGRDIVERLLGQVSSHQWGQARRYVCQVLVAVGEFGRAELLLTEMAYHRGAGLDVSAVSEMAGMGELYRIWGRLTDGFGYADIAWHVARLHGWRGLMCHSGTTRARYLSTGNGEAWVGMDRREAVRTARRLLDVAWNDGRIASAVGALVVLGKCHLEEGRPDLAVKAVGDALEFAHDYRGIPIGLKEETFALRSRVSRQTGHVFALREADDFDPAVSYQGRVDQIEDVTLRRHLLERNPWRA